MIYECQSGRRHPITIATTAPVSAIGIYIRSLQFKNPIEAGRVVDEHGIETLFRIEPWVLTNTLWMRRAGDAWEQGAA